MLMTDMDVFLQRPDETAKRILHPATIVQPPPQPAACLKEDLPLAAGESLLVYYELKRRFVKQPARITAILTDTEHPVIGFETQGDPVSADSREFYRVSTVTMDLVARFGSSDCQLTDVSVRGFSVISEQDHPMGDRVPVTLFHEDATYGGTGLIQSIKDLGAGCQRYGLLAMEAADGKELEKGLQKMSMDLQRRQLKRRARE